MQWLSLIIAVLWVVMCVLPLGKCVCLTDTTPLSRAYDYWVAFLDNPTPNPSRSMWFFTYDLSGVFALPRVLHSLEEYLKTEVHIYSSLYGSFWYVCHIE
ncbi:hypothetical protein DFH06DRAFT_465072 [Mycena polygramma]|nr:hypothetical protein DFH06DRAFT_465072 [Mycena polygramma]